MKILHVAVFIEKSTNVWQANALEKVGCEVIRYDYRQRARDLDGLNGKLLKDENKKRDNELIKLCRKESPDMILFSKCNKMNIRVVKQCKKVGKTVLWFMDGKRLIDDEARKKIETCDYIFCSTVSCVNIAKELGKEAQILQGGYDSKVHYPMDLPKIYDAIFIGSKHNQERRRYVKKGNFKVFSGLYNKDHSRVISQTRINLNLTLGDGASNRIYKIMASKGFLLTQPWMGMERIFEPGKDFMLFRNPGELNKLIDYYLKNKAEREKIAEHAFNTVQKYNDINYAKRILERVK